MKSLISVLLVIFVLAFSFCACGETNDTANNETNEDYNETQVIEGEDEEIDETVSDIPETSYVESDKPTNATSSEQNKYVNASDFVIEGKWKNVGTYNFGQVQSGAIVIFNGVNCNFYSPRDTYAFYKDGSHYKLDCTSLLAETLSFTVKIIDENNIHIYTGSNHLELKRVG